MALSLTDVTNSTVVQDMTDAQSNFTAIQTEINNAMDGEATLLAKNNAQDTLVAANIAAIAALTVGTGCPVSSNDTTPGYLNGKLVAGNHTTLTENNDGGNETLTIDGKIYTVTKAATGTLSEAEMSNTVINNYGQSAAMTLTMDPAAEGCGFIVQAGTSGFAIHLDPDDGDKFYLDGVALDDGDKISLASPAVGDYVTVWAVKTGASAYDWIATSGPTYWTDGGA